MVNIDIYRDKSGNIVKFITEGHTGYAEIGNDILCAAVSSLTQTAVLGLGRVLGIGVGFEIRDAYLECILPEELDLEVRGKANAILDTMFLGLREYEAQFKDEHKKKQYIYIREMEV